ncbi:MAG: metallophosphoesterase, partial [Clostridia bacterium]|nr:metallophosphoesterase [Clostridia bacterium]
MKKLCLLAATVLLLTMIPFSTTVSAAAPSIKLDSTVYEPSQTITVTYSGTDTNDWVGIYPYGTVPGGINSLVWQYSVGSGTVTFDVSSLNGAGDYRACLCDNNGYAILDVAEFTVRDGDPADYGVTSASVQASVTSGKSEIDVTITPSSAASLTYRLYWAANGVRLNDYLYIKEFTHSGASPFTVSLNDCLVMPDAANSIEVAVVNGRSTSYFTAAPQKLKAPTSKKLYEFQVVSDIHLTTSVQAHVPNFKAAMTDIATMSPNSNGIFFVGDNTDRGTQEHYDLLAQSLAEVEASVDLPALYFAMGNHDQVYGGTYDEEVARFIENLKMPGLYYSVDLNGSRFIILGSEKQTTAGDIGSAQLDWFEAQLAATDPSMPVFVFMHQSLRDTVSGSLTSMGQSWYGVPEATARMRSILKNYPNAFLFTGHTHWSFEMTQPFLYGNGEDANFMNTASVAYLYSDDDQDLPGSEGLYIEVYEDYILIKGREFTQSKWCAAAQFLIPRNTSASAGDLVSDEVADWTFDGSVMNVETTDYATVFSNMNDLWPFADYAYDTPIIVDPDTAAIYYDFVLEPDARTNIYVTFGKTAVSIAPFISGVSYDSGSGDIIGDGTRIRGSIPMSELMLEASCYNSNGSLTATQTRVYASGAANAKLYVYDLSLISDSAAKTISLMNPDTLAVVDQSLRGGYTYRNGSL